MQQRPTFIDLRSKSSETMHSNVSSQRAFPSPRLQHLDGDIPPAMSPLDMFAAQSRMLAKQLDESKRSGRRVSRLPPLTTTDPITKQKSLYQRSTSAGQTPRESGSSPQQKEEEPAGALPEVEEPQFRPKSFYPRMSHIPPVEDDENDESPGPASSISLDNQPFVTPAEFQSTRSDDYFGAPRARSPEPAMTSSIHSEPPDLSPRYPLPQHPQRPAHQSSNRSQSQREMSIESTSSRGCNFSLAPPKSPHVKQTSIRSIPVDSSDDEHSASTAESGFSRNRKLSSSSNVSIPNSPLAPFAQAHGRSPSTNSEYSIGGSRLARPAFNFSRPLSRASQPSSDMPRQHSFDSRPSTDVVRPPFTYEQRQISADSQGFLFVDDGVHTPTSMDGEQPAEGYEGQDPPAPSYIYTKFSLPRGRMIQKDPGVLKSNDLRPSEWEGPYMKPTMKPTTPLANRPVSPPSPMRSAKVSIESQRQSPRPSFEQRARHSGNPSVDLHRTSPRSSLERRFKHSPRPSFEQKIGKSLRSPFEQPGPSPRPPTEQSHKVLFQQLGHMHPPPLAATDDVESEYTASTRSGSTVKARARQTADPLEQSAEDHLAKGIALHERGEARESTYHLRIAAKQNLPTAMLLYALACRHGWGMRPNPQEGVQWLRRAADSASLEIAVDDDSNNGDVQERKTRRAQFALSVYELGQSHYNGWGIEQDRVLALRCFEIAASWGDPDAMAEAGFCYANGGGCKKDLKKAAKYYRMAEAKGMSMVGNSW